MAKSTHHVQTRDAPSKQAEDLETILRRFGNQWPGGDKALKRLRRLSQDLKHHASPSASAGPSEGS